MTQESDDAPFKYSLSGPGMAVERNLTQAVAFATLQVALGAMPAASSSLTTSEAASGSNGRKVSLREYLQEVVAKTYPSKIVATGRYLRDHENLTDFSRDEIKDRFRSAGEPPASNLPRDFTTAIGAGWIAEDHEKRGRYYVTRKGDEAAENLFEGGAPSTKMRRKRRSGPTFQNPDMED